MFFPKIRFFKVEKLSFPPKKQKDLSKKNSVVHELAIVNPNFKLIDVVVSEISCSPRWHFFKNTIPR